PPAGAPATAGGVGGEGVEDDDLGAEPVRLPEGIFLSGYHSTSRRHIFSRPPLVLCLVQREAAPASFGMRSSSLSTRSAAKRPSRRSIVPLPGGSALACRGPRSSPTSSSIRPSSSRRLAAACTASRLILPWGTRRRCSSPSRRWR